MLEYAKPKQKHDEKKTVQKKQSDGMGTQQNLTGIPIEMKTEFEDRSGFSFDDVRVHYNSDKPAQLQALAYTQGNQIYVGPNQEKHLGHELGHVVQQKLGIVRPTETRGNVAVNTDNALEKQADQLACINKTEKDPACCDVVQMQGERANNPYQRSDSKTSHHIIPHSFLMEMMELMEEEQQTAIKQRFIPQLTTITLRQLHAMNVIAIVDNVVKVGNREVVESRDFIAQNSIDAPISQQLIDAINAKIDEFGGSDEEKISIDNKSMQDSFYEWQQGNLFQAIKDRAEPAASDDFDWDAKYFYDAEYTASLKKIYISLNAQKNIFQSVSAEDEAELGAGDLRIKRRAKAEIIRLFASLAALTSSKPIATDDVGEHWNVFDKETACMLINIFNEKFLPLSRMKNLTKAFKIPKKLVAEEKLKEKVEKSIDSYQYIVAVSARANEALNIEFAKKDIQIKRSVNAKLDLVKKALNQYRQNSFCLKLAEGACIIADRIVKNIEKLKTVGKAGTADLLSSIRDIDVRIIQQKKIEVNLQNIKKEL